MFASRRCRGGMGRACSQSPIGDKRFHVACIRGGGVHAHVYCGGSKLAAVRHTRTSTPGRWVLRGCKRTMPMSIWRGVKLYRRAGDTRGGGGGGVAERARVREKSERVGERTENDVRVRGVCVGMMGGHPVVRSTAVVRSDDRTDVFVATSTRTAVARTRKTPNRRKSGHGPDVIVKCTAYSNVR